MQSTYCSDLKGVAFSGGDYYIQALHFLTQWYIKMGKFQVCGKSQGLPRGFGEQQNLAIYFEGTWDIFGINLRDV